MKKVIPILVMVLSSVSVSAGEYTDSCYNKGLNKQEVYGCLDKIEQSATQLLKEKFDLIKNKAKAYNHPRLLVTSEDLLKMDYSFKNYMSEQCKLMGGASLGSGASQESTDCNIRLLHSRINDIDYILKNYYQ